ncbi:MAG: hypothetical protein HUJ99_03455, partial [Bacteroidaceae bacterium]|nr:hypothetical protein [Bacteroidaceae bacterium]
EGLPDIHGNQFNSWGARLGTLAMLPIEADDTVFIGDEMIHSGEWHELLDSPHAKNRGTGWGYPGADIGLLMTEIPHFFHANPKSVCPRSIVLYAGAQEVENGMELKAFEEKFRALVALLHEQAPTAQIRILSVLRNEDEAKDKQFTQAYNEVLRRIAKKDKLVSFVDIYTPLLAPEMMMGNYVSGQGYLKIAELLK